jgi:hypothetical protein
MSTPVTEPHKSPPLSRSEVLEQRRVDARVDVRVNEIVEAVKQSEAPAQRDDDAAARRDEAARRESLARLGWAREVITKDMFERFLERWRAWAVTCAPGRDQRFATGLLLDLVGISWSQQYQQIEWEKFPFARGVRRGRDPPAPRRSRGGLEMSDTPREVPLERQSALLEAVEQLRGTTPHCVARVARAEGRRLR